MHIAVICKQANYDRISAALIELNSHLQISQPLTSWNTALEYIHGAKIDGVVIEESISFFSQVSSLPLPSLVYSGHHRDFRDAAKKWITSLGLAITSISEEKHPEDSKQETEVIITSPENNQSKKLKTGTRVAIVAKDSNLVELITSFGGIQIVASTSSFQDVMSLETLNQPEVIFIEEGVMPKEEPTLRELKINQIVTEYKDVEGVRLVMMLFERKNTRVYKKMIEKGFYNFLAKNNVTSADIERLIKVPRTHQDTIEYQDEELVVPVHVENEVQQLDPSENNNQPDENSKPQADISMEESIAKKSFLMSRSSEPTTTIDEKKVVKDVRVETTAEGFSNHSEVSAKESEEASQIPAVLETPEPEVPKPTKRKPFFQNIFRKVILPDAISQTSSPKLIEKKMDDQIGRVSNQTVFAYPMPHRVLFYSPKGGAGSTSIVVDLAEGAADNALGVAEIAYSYGQIAGRLGLHPSYTISDSPDGMEELAVCKEKYLCSPWIYSVKKPFNDTLVKEWLVRAERAFGGKTILADLQSQSSPLILMASHEWCTKSIWVVQNTSSHLGMAELQMSHLKKMGNDWRKIGILIQGGTKERLPWEEELGIPVIGTLPSDMLSKDWRLNLQDIMAEYLRMPVIV
ncbi:hypothetical protein HP548_12115 [Paenibacillus taichungensis]|uniref:Uncharacterized protein n=1 Tax=Paenibacillus taichungensis TaxID=484184 RepID=A0ABX2MLC2_9BACL|nr:hypothetical protein [Paenibacillus taichungensis]NUU54824.1 hypothetical protein [Paenibacillus taichungensis]